MAEPAISVLMPVRNGAATIGLALTDLIAGLGPRDEILVMDDGSEDATGRIVRGFAQDDSRIRIISTPHRGLVQTLNQGLAEVQHRWVARADADDRYPADRLHRQRQECRDGVALISGDYTVFGPSGVLGRIPTALTPPFVLTSLLHPHRVPHPGVVFDRDAVVSVGGYRDEDFPVEDLGLWLRLVGTGDFVGVPTVTVAWRMHAASVTHRKQRAQREMTLRMLSSSFPESAVTSMDPAHVGRELAAYERAPAAGDRRLLLARDLRALAARGIGRTSYHESLHALGRHPLETLSSVGSLTAQRLRRRRARRTITPG